MRRQEEAGRRREEEKRTVVEGGAQPQLFYLAKVLSIAPVAQDPMVPGVAG